MSRCIIMSRPIKLIGLKVIEMILESIILDSTISRSLIQEFNRRLYGLKWIWTSVCRLADRLVMKHDRFWFGQTVFSFQTIDPV